MDKPKYGCKIIASFEADTVEVAKRILATVEQAIADEGGRIYKFSTFYGEGTGSASSKGGVNVASTPE